MIRSEKKLKELEENLKKQNKLTVINTVKSLREEEPFEGAICLLAELYNKSDDHSVRKTIEDFCNDLKDLSVRPEIIAEIRKPWNQDTIGMLVASCWQSGLDYSDYLPELTNTFLEGNYTTAIECMTVIEESTGNCSRENKDGIIKIIEESPLAGLNEKSPLTLELLAILER